MKQRFEHCFIAKKDDPSEMYYEIVPLQEQG